MKTKTLTIIIGILLVMPLLSAQGNITNLILNQPIPDFIAGETVSTIFSFNYPNISSTYPDQIKNAPLVFVVNISSNNSNYPVWKNDFELWGVTNNVNDFNCTEDDHVIYYAYDEIEINNIPNGTFYCTDEDFLAMDLDSSNEVTLNIKSNPALWPGKYNFSVGLFYPENLTEMLINVTVYSPVSGIYNSRRVLFNVTFGKTAEKIEYINWVNGGRWRRLCSNCYEYGFFRKKLKTLKEGENNISFRGVFDGTQDTENILLFIDSKKPKIRKTYPQRGFASGLFEVEFDEDNPKELWLNYGNSYRNAKVNLSECVIDRRYTKCNITVNLTDYDGQEIEYWFNLTDIAGNTDESRHRDLDVDVSFPKINNASYGIDGKYVYFIINVTEPYLDEVGYSYIDSKNKSREKRLCSRLKDGICERKVSFSDGFHNITIYVIDKIGNKVGQELQFFIDSKPPRISRTKPRRNSVTNGSEFYIKYTEDNLEKIELFWNPSHVLTGCPTGKNQECTTSVNLSTYDGQEIEYWFEVSDSINTKESRKTKVKVDTTSPVLTLNLPENTTYYSRRIPFNISVSEDVTLEYIDNLDSNPRWRRLCSRCDEYGETRTKRKSFKRGVHDLQIRAVDKAGNSDEEFVSFVVDY